MSKARKVPGHLAIIMDGNGRWASRLGRPRWMGHVRGAHTVKEVVAHCVRAGVQHLTLYAFSSDNWKRPREEVGFLFDLFASHLDRQVDALVRNGIRLTIFGRRDRLPAELVAAFEMAEARTAHGTRMHLRVAVDYSSRAAIERGDERLPDVDLLLRTGGERRLSDFLLWESAYAELAFLDVNFPDLTSEHLDLVFADFASRDRRFGGVKEPQRV
ncbi:polyprenyl diphosphate synthase [Pseudogemmatithrix spongiicola]|uniref:Isoprenyl transferase n=1 Tax=Pseudogemmatithrix spongiicola TaxID=3062599 RepID=A0AA49JZL2_9BACT|nr:polyprenyl diphosphate synthase [Gemmatimonadaceae bacterium 'strain 138']WKW14779.1 polyprenyl diphosphate synthase [Gemmatimonadaceae bacterium 'strain 318']